MALMQLAKGRGITVFVIGHVNKEGNLAGPKVLEHMVDCVLYFEGDRHMSYRILRAAKNRYGATNEIGVFEMDDTGLRAVSYTHLSYYTLWVHQIKTPIAAMDLLLQAGPDRATEMEIELQKIAQYVDMVLQYLRLDSTAKDLVLQRCQLDAVVRQTVRKYAKLFILKKIQLVFQETKWEVLSDEKWLCFLLEPVSYTHLDVYRDSSICDRYWVQIPSIWLPVSPGELPRADAFAGQGARLYGLFRLQPTGIKRFLFFA